MPQNISQLNEGLDFDSSPLTVGENKITYAENRVISSIEGDKNLSTTELGNELGFILTDQNNTALPTGIVLGSKSIDSKIVYAISAVASSGIYVYNTSIISVLDIQTNTYKNVFITLDDIAHGNVDFLNFTNTNVKYVQMELRYNYLGELIIYLVDGANIPKAINIGLPPFSTPGYKNPNVNATTGVINSSVSAQDFSNIFNLFNNNAPLSYITPQSPLITDGGDLITTVFQFGIRHKVSASIYTAISNISNSIPIVDKSETVAVNKYYGNVPDTLANKAINITLNNLSTDYPFIDLIVIYYTGLASQIKIGIVENIPITGTTMDYTFSTLLSITSYITFNELVQTFAKYDSAKTIIQKDNSLILAGLTKKYDSTDWQAIADSFDIQGIYNQVSVHDYSNVVNNPSGGSGASEVSDSGSYLSNKELYKDPLSTFELRTWCFDEVESFAFVPIFTDGTQGFAYHIQAPSVGANDIVPNTENYPTLNYSTYSNLGTYIGNHMDPIHNINLRFHLFPKFTDSYTTNSIQLVENQNTNAGDPQLITIIKLRFHCNSSLLATAIANNVIVGWKIVRQPKNNTQNKRVITTGILPTATNSCIEAGGAKASVRVSPFFTPIILGTYGGVSPIPGTGTANNQNIGWNNSSTFSADKALPILFSPDFIENNLASNTISHFQVNGAYIIDTNITSGSSIIIRNNTIIPNGQIALKGFIVVINSRKIDSTITGGGLRIVTNGYIPVSYTGRGTITIATATYTHEALDAIVFNIANSDYNGGGVSIPPAFSTDWDNSGNFQDCFDTHNSGGGGTNGIIPIQIGQNSSETITSASTFPQYVTIPFAVAYNINPNIFGAYFQFTYIDVCTNYLDSNSANPYNTPDNNTIKDVANGDKFWSKYAIRNTAAFNLSFTDRYVDCRNLFYGWFLTEGNYDYKHYIPSTTTNITGGTQPYYPAYPLLINNGDTDGVLSFPVDFGYSTGYNKQYQIINNLFTYFVKPATFNQVSSFLNRRVYSSTQTDGDSNDLYRIFLHNNYSDLPKNKGSIVKMFIRGSTLFTQTFLGLWQDYYNSLNQQTTDIGQVYLGTGQAFSIPSTPITNDNTGGLQHFTGGITTPNGEVWFDSASKILWLFNGVLQSINNDLDIYLKRIITGSNIDYLKYTSFLDSPYKDNKGVLLTYDHFFNRLLILFKGLTVNGINLQLSFSFEKDFLDWSSVHTYDYAFMNSNDKILLNVTLESGNLKLWKWYTTNSKNLVVNGVGIPFKIEHIINNGVYSQQGRLFKNSPEDTKVFDNLIFKTKLNSSTKSFDKLTISNDTQNRIVDLVEDDSDFAYENYEDPSTTKGVLFKNNEYRLFIPKDLNPTEPIRFKDKYLRLRYELITPNISGGILINTFKFVIYYIKIIFRINER